VIPVEFKHSLGLRIDYRGAVKEHIFYEGTKDMKNFVDTFFREEEFLLKLFFAKVCQVLAVLFLKIYLFKVSTIDSLKRQIHQLELLSSLHLSENVLILHNHNRVRAFESESLSHAFISDLYEFDLAVYEPRVFIEELAEQLLLQAHL